MRLADAAAHDARAMFLQMGEMDRQQGAPWRPAAWRQDELPGVNGDGGALRGEITADGRHMVLWTTGTAWEQKQIAQRLHLVTASGESARDENGQPTGARYYPLSWAVIVQLGFIFNSGPRPVWQPWPRLTEWIIAETVRRTSPPPAIPECWPETFRPYPHQLDGAAAIASAGKYLLGDEPGCGKTASALLGIEARRLAGTDVLPMIIVVPSWEVARVWEDHIRELMPHWPAPVLHRGPNRARVQGWKHGRYILITTYATMRRDAPDMRGLLVKIRAKTVVADECHLARNTRAKQSRALWRVAHYAPTMVWASGTLVTHDFGDIYQPLFTMAPLDWPSKDGLKDRYLATRRTDYDETVLGLRPEMEAEFFAALAGQLRRVAKADVLKFLPDKIYSVRRPEMPPAWRHAYDTMEAQMLAELPDGGELPVMSILAQLTRLSQLASSAADVTVTTELDEATGLLVPHYHVTLRPPCWKAEALLDLLAERPDQPTAVFAESRQLAMITGEYCRKAGLRTGYVTGPGDSGPYGEPGVKVTNRSRQNAVDDFQAGKLDVIICTLGAGGLGITLTASNCAAMLQRSYQFDLAIQPEDRVHRIGAEIHDHVEIVDFVTVDSIDQRRREVLRDKAGQLGQLVRDPRIVRALLGGLS
jgi:SNF2 family DNA or RNA helicase